MVSYYLYQQKATNLATFTTTEREAIINKEKSWVSCFSLVLHDDDAESETGRERGEFSAVVAEYVFLFIALVFIVCIFCFLFKNILYLHFQKTRRKLGWIVVGLEKKDRTYLYFF